MGISASLEDVDGTDDISRFGLFIPPLPLPPLWWVVSTSFWRDDKGFSPLPSEAFSPSGVVENDSDGRFSAGAEVSVGVVTVGAAVEAEDPLEKRRFR